MIRSSALALAGLLGAGCGSETTVPMTPPSATPTSPPAVSPGAHTGLTEITFLAAEPPPGSTLTGCLGDASGCDGRIRMRFRLRNPTGGPVLDAIGFLHTTSLLACWRGTTGPFRLEAGATEVLIVFDRREPACFAPSEIATMKLVVEGTVEVASLQEWAIRYDLRP
jgi:hypothetical protein